MPEDIGDTKEKIGIKAEGHLGWVKQWYRALDDLDMQMVSELLIGTPAIGMSAQSAGFAERFLVTTTDGAEGLLDVLTEGIKPHIFKTLYELGEWLSDQDKLEDDFWSGGEFIAMYVNDKSREAVEPIAKETRASGTAGAAKRADIVKERFAETDSFFRHLRNALAHGQFARFDKTGNGSVYAFQDESVQGFISARMVITKEHMHTIISLMHKYDNSGF